MEGIQLSVEKAGLKNEISIIKVGGYIDTTTSAELEHSLESLLRDGIFNIIIDLGDVDYISSAGWGIFISEIKGIREKGGDLKLVRMIPDVYEVFELLEFHFILKAFNTIEDAVEDFDKSGKAGNRVRPTLTTMDSKTSVPEGATGETHRATTGAQGVTHADEIDAEEPADSSGENIEEKIKKIVMEDPEAGSIKIMKKLKSPQFGNMKITWFQVRKYLNLLELDTKKKRMEYYKQITVG
ncbi:STAS domain-containing protein [candidate division KSB1 bacterium]|nr:STAS domain-containing protein [candidate division KSB1 bacterium]